MTDTRSSSGTEGLDQCPVCRSRLVSLYEKQTGLFAVGCDNDDCHFTVEAYGTTQADAVRQWNTRGVAQQPANPSDAIVALNAIEAQLHEMRSLKGWRFNLIRENLARAKEALSLPSTSRGTITPEDVAWAESEIDKFEASKVPPADRGTAT